MAVSADEVELRRKRFAQIEEAWRNDPAHRDIAQLADERWRLGDELRQELADFLEGRSDGPQLRDFVGSWSRGKPILGFAGAAGAMFLNQLVNDGIEAGVEDLLRQVLTVPDDWDDAEVRVDRLQALVEELREAGSAAAVRRAPFFLSWFWALQDPGWRRMWPSSDRMMLQLGWMVYWYDRHGERYRDYLEILHSLSDDAAVAEEVLSWADRNDLPVGLDPTLMERCRLARELRREPPGESDSATSDEEYEQNRVNLRVILNEMGRLGKRLQPSVEAVLGRKVQPGTPTEYWVPSARRLRADAWVSFRPHVDGPSPGLRLQVGSRGVHFVLNAEVNRNPKGYSAEALRTLKAHKPSGWEFFNHPSSTYGDLEGVLPEESHTLFNLGVELDPAELASIAGLERVVAEHTAVAKGLLDRLYADTELPAEDGTVVEDSGAGFDLAELAGRFVVERGYPDDGDADHKRGREEWAHHLAPARLAGLTKGTFRRLLAKTYGHPGFQSALNVTVRDADETEWERLLRSIDTLLWGNEPFERRIDRVLDEGDLGFRGLKEAVVMKLLAVAHPDRFLVAFPFSGDYGKAVMLRRLGVPAPSLQLSAGERQVAANDLLRERTEPLFPGDPWGQSQFLYWLIHSSDSGETNEGGDDEVDGGVEQRIADAAKELFLDRSFLDDIVGLLDDKRQVIFYGPPGTGKTYVAQLLAEALAPEVERRMLVQFHPSTTYEDFFEGYRPDPTPGGGLTYRLVPGPLRLLADAAEADPDRTYILIVDEINRANLPKVFGELLFLLEYRDRAARVLYRPEVEFRLPPNLWIIGTMNTADRSIALVDAALRRRFHFVPFIPDIAGRNPVSQVLRRWVDEGKELETLPDIVDRVNNQLRAALGGDHLLLGPSYFMKKGIDEASLRQVWQYQIEPLIEDLFFGEPERAEAFRFDRVWQELGAPAVDDDAAGADGQP